MAGRDFSAELFGSTGGAGRDFSAELFGEPSKEESGFLRQAADIPLSIGRGALTGVRMIADAFGAGSGASEAIKSAEGYVAGLMSAQARNDEQEIARIMKDAEDKGVLDQVQAAFKAFTVAPVDLLTQGLGTAGVGLLGMLGGKVLGAGTLGLRAIGVASGAGMGAGAAKGGIYEEVKAALLDAKIDEARAEKAALEAQAYGGKNLDQILLSAGLGAVTGGVGIEGVASRILSRAAAKEAAGQAAKGAIREAGEGALKTAAAEGLPEYLQGSQEQLAKNIALQREGFDVDTMRGVVGSGVLEGLAGAGLGAIAGGTEAGLRRQARAEAERVLAEEEKQRIAQEEQAERQRIEAERIAEEERMRPIREAEARVPAEEPVGPSITRTGRAALMGGEDPLAVAMRARREAEEAKAEVPLGEDYAFLQREKQRLQAAEQTPETKAELGRIEQQIQSVLQRDLSDIEKAKTSVFAQEQLPSVESRGAVVAERDLAEMQAREGLPEGMTDFDVQQARKVERLAGKPFVDEAALEEQKTKEKELRSLKAERNKIQAGGNLYKMLEEKLDPSEVKDIATDIKKVYGKGYKPLESPTGQGTFISELVENGILDNYLPMEMRPSAANFDVQKSTEYIKDKIRNKETKFAASQEEIQKLDNRIAELSDEIDRPARTAVEITEANLAERQERAEALGAEAIPEIEAFRQQAREQGIDTSVIEEQAFEEARENPDLNPDTILAERLSDALGMPRYQRETVAGESIGKDRTQSIVDAVKSQWANAPEVVVAESMDDPAIPAEVRAHNKAAMQKGAKGSPRGFFYKGKAYVLADAATSPTQVMETLFHEALGHYGLRGTFGPEMETVLRDVVKYRRTDVEAKAKQYGLDPKNESDMLEAAEEVLAEIAQTKPGLSFVKRAIAVIRNFLRKLGLPFEMSNDDIIQKYILPARAFVEKGGSKAVEGKPAAMREGRVPQTITVDDKERPTTNSNGQPIADTEEGVRNFWRWFGDSKVVDEQGRPLVVYHGTPYGGFSEFDPSRSGTRDTFESARAGIYFSQTPRYAGALARSAKETGPAIYPAYLSIKNPLRVFTTELTEKPEVDQMIADARAGGHDGIIDEMGNFVVFRSDQIKSATGNVGAYGQRPITKEEAARFGMTEQEAGQAQVRGDIRYQREAEPEERVKEPKRNILGNPVIGSWTMPTDTKLAGTEFGKDDLIYSLQDKQVDIKRVVQNITETAGRIAAKWNPYLQEELYHGRTARATKEFLQDELRPLIQEIQRNGMTIEEVENYLHNRHAEDYNKHVAKVNPKNPRMQDGGSGIKTEDARAYLASIPADKRKVYEDIAKKVDAITKKTRNLVVKSGLEGPDTIAAWEKAFPKYVPLMREESDDFDYTTPAFGVGSGFDVRGKFSRAAMGSERKVANILANIAMQREKAIIKSNKNRVAQAVFGLAVQNPNPDFWLAVNPAAEEVPEIALDELRAMGIDEGAIEFLMQEPKQRAIDPKKNEVVSRINATLRKSDNVLAMRINGEDRYVFFNQNDPRAKRAAQALKNIDADQLGPVLGIVSKITRWMASVNTQYNPIFGAYNFLRDVQGAALQLSDTPLKGMQKQVLSGVLPSLKTIYSAMRAERDGKKLDTEMARLWNEFQEEGGQTGFRDMFSRSQERAEALEKEFKQITEGKVKAAGRAVIDWLSDYNDSMENATRLSAYKVAKEKFIKEGMSESEAKQQAASVAKNLTVNFNRKGQIATQAGALYAFFNAAVQGTTRLIQTLRGPAGRKIIAGGLLLGTMQAALLAMAGFDEEEPPEFVRERNIIIPLGGDKYFAFPMPLGYHVIPGLSRIVTEWALSGFKDTPDRIASLTGMFLEAFNPIGNAGWSVQTLAPTFADPLVALSENKDWTGKPIARKDFSNMDPTPGYTRAKEGANILTEGIAKFLNFATGGTRADPGLISPTPEQIEYLIGQATGGIGREVTKAITSVEKTITGEELPPYKIPLYGRFVGETKSSAAESNRFYKNMERLNVLDREIKIRRENREPIAEFMRENPEARMAPMARSTYRDIQALRKRREQLVEKGAPRESVKAVEEQIRRRMAMFNERVAQLKD